MDDRRPSRDDGHFAEREVVTERAREARYAGLRMTAAEYEQLPDDGFRYELIDGVVVMSPSASFGHADAAGEIERQIRNYLDDHPVGRVAHETDVIFDALRVYRPDLVFLRNERVPPAAERIHTVPDMVLEVLSPGTEARDLSTKHEDYERFGVAEYWIVDPGNVKLTFLRLVVTRGRAAYQPVAAKGSKFASKAIPGFTLDIAAVKRTMRG